MQQQQQQHDDNDDNYLHAHWDCSCHVLSAQILFATCVNAWMMRISSSSSDHIQSLQPILQSFFQNSNTMLPDCIIQLHAHSNEDTQEDTTTIERSNNQYYISIDILNGSTHFVPTHDNDTANVLLLQRLHNEFITHLKSMIQQILSESIETKLPRFDQQVNSNSSSNNMSRLSSCTLKLILEVVSYFHSYAISSKYYDTNLSSNNQQQEEVTRISKEDRSCTLIKKYVTIVSYMIGSFYILYDCLHVQTVSCQPIIITSLLLKQFSHIIIDIPIQINDHSIMNQSSKSIGEEESDHQNNLMTLDGICLLRHILQMEQTLKTMSSTNNTQQMNKNEKVHISYSIPPFRLIQPMTTGYYYYSTTLLDDDYDKDQRKYYKEMNVCLFLGRLLHQNTTTSCDKKQQFVSDSSHNNNHNVNESTMFSSDPPDYDQETKRISSQNVIIPNPLHSQNRKIEIVIPTLIESIKEKWNDCICTTSMILFETNIDDTTAEHLSYACERILNNHIVVDVWTTSITMKKGRCGHTLHCLCNAPPPSKNNANNNIPTITTTITRGNSPSCNDNQFHEQHHDYTMYHDVIQSIFHNTTTLGIRIQTIDRVALHRTIIPVTLNYDDDGVFFVEEMKRSLVTCTNISNEKDDDTINESNYFLFPIRDDNDNLNEIMNAAVPKSSSTTVLSSSYIMNVKVGYLNGKIISFKAEYEDCKEISMKSGISIQQIAIDAVVLARRSIMK